MFLFNILTLVTYEDPEGVFSKHFNRGDIIIATTGSSKQTINGTLQYTKPEYSVYPYVKRFDWCSNCGTNYEYHPWISYSIRNHRIRFNGYFIRCGCCYGRCCCNDDIFDYCYYCCLYSWSILISDDNETWTEVHRVVKEKTLRRCNEKTFNLDKEYTTRFVRIYQNEPCPGEPPCISLNKIELLGTTIRDDQANSEDFVSFHDDDEEDVSIIGHISKNKGINI